MTDSPIPSYMTSPIRTSYDPKPIPLRNWDWCACRENDYEPGAPLGWGSTEYTAIHDLIIRESEARIQRAQQE